LLFGIFWVGGRAHDVVKIIRGYLGYYFVAFLFTDDFSITFRVDINCPPSALRPPLPRVTLIIHSST
jgi:hypothetical protein